jgi:hypothetical protein
MPSVAAIATHLAGGDYTAISDPPMQRTVYPDACPKCTGADLLGRTVRGTLSVPDDLSRVWCSWCGTTTLGARIAGRAR